MVRGSSPLLGALGVMKKVPAWHTPVSIATTMTRVATLNEMSVGHMLAHIFAPHVKVDDASAARDDVPDAAALANVSFDDLERRYFKVIEKQKATQALLTAANARIKALQAVASPLVKKPHKKRPLPEIQDAVVTAVKMDFTNAIDDAGLPALTLLVTGRDLPVSSATAKGRIDEFDKSIKALLLAMQENERQMLNKWMTDTENGKAWLESNESAGHRTAVVQDWVDKNIVSEQALLGAMDQHCISDGSMRGLMNQVPLLKLVRESRAARRYARDKTQHS